MLRPRSIRHGMTETVTREMTRETWKGPRNTPHWHRTRSCCEQDVGAATERDELASSSQTVGQAVVGQQAVKLEPA